MKYYIIAGEPSGDLHGSKLIKEIFKLDKKAKIRFWGGDLMKKNGGGSIINFSSISYMMGNEGYPVYATAKSAITGLTRSLARELGPFNIRVNAILPGWVLTKRQMDLWATEEGLSKHLDRQCLKEHLSGTDIVGGTLFLASGTSKMMTSQALVIDGGVVVTG